MAEILSLLCSDRMGPVSCKKPRRVSAGGGVLVGNGEIRPPQRRLTCCHPLRPPPDGWFGGGGGFNFFHVGLKVAVRASSVQKVIRREGGLRSRALVCPAAWLNPEVLPTVPADVRLFSSSPEEQHTLKCDRKFEGNPPARVFQQPLDLFDERLGFICTNFQQLLIV